MNSSVVLSFLRAKTEVDDVIGMKKDISYDDLGQLIYLSQVHVIMIKKIRGLFFWFGFVFE